MLQLAAVVAGITAVVVDDYLLLPNIDYSPIVVIITGAVFDDKFDWIAPYVAVVVPVNHCCVIFVGVVVVQ